MNTYHILNGDALKDQFPTDLAGEIIVMRECLVDGPVHGDSLADFFRTRAEFLDSTYHDPNEKYAQKAVPEITKIANINSGEVNLWFEDDLFCQVNLWFVCSLLYTKKVQVNLVRPEGSSLQYGFGGLDKEGLVKAFKKKRTLTPVNVNQFAILWFNYRKQGIERLLKLSVQVYENFPFVKEAVNAHVERFSLDGKMGRPEQTILDIIQEKSTTDFGVIFREFCQRVPIYGFGDLQVKKIYDNVSKSI
ncbi:MAG: DUF1835 domain-containing protein [Marinoscillum sp.]